MRGSPVKTHRSSKGEHRIVYRPPRRLWLVTLGSFCVVVALMVVALMVPLDKWYILGSVVLCGVGVLAFLELAAQHVTLDGGTLVFSRGFRRREVDRAEIASVHWSRGSGVALKLVDGRWVRLPGVGRTDQGVANGIRAWLKRTGNDRAEEYV